MAAQKSLHQKAFLCALGLSAAINLTTVSPAQAQALPPAALEAEDAKQWDKAIDLYKKALADHPERYDIWERIADIDSTRNKPAEAEAAMAEALKIKPRNTAFLLKHGQLAAWAGDNAGAESSYRAILQLNPEDDKTRLALGTVLSWDGKTSESIAVIEPYIKRHPKDKKALLLLSQLYMWNGENDKAAATLERYKKVAGADKDYKKIKAQLLANAHETTDTAKMPFARGDFTYSTDSDTIEIGTYTLDGQYKINPETFLLLGAETGWLQASATSAYTTVNGDNRINHSAVWIGLDRKIGSALSLNGHIGYHDAGYGLQTTTIVHGGAEFHPVDALTLTYDIDHDFYAVSPLALSKGIKLTDNQLQSSWHVGPTTSFDVKANYGTFSDSNHYWSVIETPRQAIITGDKLNADINFSGHEAGFANSVTDGYYDPTSFIQFMVGTAVSYSFTPDNKIGASAGIGYVEDNTMDTYKRANDFAVDANFGLHSPWQFNAHAGHSDSVGLGSQKYSIESYTFNVMRQF